MWAWMWLAACGEHGSTADDTAAWSGTFVQAVVDFQPGEGAGFGAQAMPDVVYGPPWGKGPRAGSLDVVSLGREGVIVLDLGWFDDGPGVDLLVFENPFPGWLELGVVGVSDDGRTWHEWGCEAESGVGCAGVAPVLSNPDNGVDPFDPDVSGGDAFDLAVIGRSEARFVRVRDDGGNDYAGEAGGFDLDAVGVRYPR